MRDKGGFGFVLLLVAGCGSNEQDQTVLDKSRETIEWAYDGDVPGGTDHYLETFAIYTAEVDDAGDKESYPSKLAQAKQFRVKLKETLENVRVAHEQRRAVSNAVAPWARRVQQQDATIKQLQARLEQQQPKIEKKQEPPKPEQE